MWTIQSNTKQHTSLVYVDFLTEDKAEENITAYTITYLETFNVPNNQDLNEHQEILANGKDLTDIFIQDTN